MAAIPQASTLLLVLSACILVGAGQLLWNRYLNRPLFNHVVDLFRDAAQQWTFDVPFTNEYELWLDFVKSGRPEAEWKALFGFGVPPVHGVPVELKWEIRGSGGRPLAFGDVRSTQTNGFSGPTVSRFIDRASLPKGVYTFSVRFLHTGRELLGYSAFMELRSEATTSTSWRFVPYWAGSYAVTYVVLPVAVLALILIAVRCVAA